jgi:hypothetical protein
MNTYTIIRFFADGTRRTMQEGISLEEAREHCNSPNSSSKTCADDESQAWFDGYEEE